MDNERQDLIDYKSEIINEFRPIEQLFKIMDKISSEYCGDITQSFSEVGLGLCQNFRQKLDIILYQDGREVKNDR